VAFQRRARFLGDLLAERFIDADEAIVDERGNICGAQRTWFTLQNLSQN